MATDEQDLIADVDAARQSVTEAGRTGIIGYCFGGTVAYLGASMLDFACAVSYYGGGIVRLIDRVQPRVPVMYHFGADDGFIPMETIDQIREIDPTGVFHIYAGTGHGFNCDDRDGYNEAAAQLSETRSLAFLEDHL